MTKTQEKEDYWQPSVNVIELLAYIAAKSSCYYVNKFIRCIKRVTHAINSKQYAEADKFFKFLNSA